MRLKGQLEQSRHLSRKDVSKLVTPILSTLILESLARITFGKVKMRVKEEKNAC